MSQVNSRKSRNAFDIIVVGGGLFGVTTALRLAQNSKVLLLERQPDILQEASFINQNRVHFGFHYPRSFQTAAQSLDGYELFQDKFAPFMHTFETYYGILADESLTSAEDYLDFAEILKVYRDVYYTQADHRAWFLQPEACSLLIAVDEPVIDMQDVRECLRKDIQAAKNLTLMTNTTALALEKYRPFTVATSHGKYSAEYVINASYGNLSWHNHPATPKTEIQYVEMVELESARPLPGLTMMDGPKGMGILPRGRSNHYWWYSVAYSVHMRVETKHNLVFHPPFYSNWDRMYEQGKKVFTFMDDLRYVQSHFVPRTFIIDDFFYTNSERPSLIMALSPNFYQILSGKLVTSISVAEDMAQIIQNGALDNVRHFYHIPDKKTA